MDLSKQAAKIALPETYASPKAVDEILTRVRNEDPVIWIEPEGVRPLWLVSRAEDLKFVETHPDYFLAAPRPAIQLEAQEKQNMEWFGRTTGPMDTLVQMDGAHHRSRRVLTQNWFGPNRIKSKQPLIDDIAKTFVQKMADLQPQCDFASDVAFRYPLRVINAIMGLSEDFDEPFLRLTQQTFGSADDDVSDSNAKVLERLGKAYLEFQESFGPVIEDRRQNPRDDLASVLANAEIDGEPLPDAEILGYFLIVATAGHDTTSATTAGGLLALIQHPEQLKKLTENLELIPNAVEEFLRWTAPVKNFVRTATQDVDLNGKTIKKGDAVAVLFASTCRDENIFEDPFEFRIDRAPNNHLAFGTGPHLCLGMHLARMEVTAFFRELLPRLEEIELTAEPTYLQSVLVSGLKSMPIKYKMR